MTIGFLVKNENMDVSGIAPPQIAEIINTHSLCFEMNKKSTTSKCLSVLFIATCFSGCMVPVQNRDTVGTRANDPLTSSDWDKVIENDRASVRAGQLPKEVIQYDIQIGGMIPEGQKILTSQDKAKARIWSNKMHSITEARNKAIEKFSAKEIAKNNAVANAFGNGKPDPCLSPMGKNACTTPSSQQQDNSVHYTVGPGGIGANIGNITVGPGGIGAGY